jgi:hypothetical protein
MPRIRRRGGTVRPGGTGVPPLVCGHHGPAAPGVRRQDAVIPHQMRARRRDQCRQPPQKFHRIQDEIRAAIGPRLPECVLQPPVRQPLDPLLRERRTQHIPAELLQSVPITRPTFNGPFIIWQSSSVICHFERTPRDPQSGPLSYGNDKCNMMNAN